MRTLTAFPDPPCAHVATPAPLADAGLSWRRANADDIPFLRQLYGTTRADELAHIPWPEMLKQGFLDEQFALQHEHFVHYYAGADFLVVEHAGQPVGRLYAVRQPQQAFSIVDIALLPAWRGKGIGSVLITCLQHEARAQAQALLLHVSAHNPSARRLYERLNFVAEGGDEGLHQPMRWCADRVS